jgi:hypothetical protein
LAVAFFRFGFGFDFPSATQRAQKSGIFPPFTCFHVPPSATPICPHRYDAVIVMPPPFIRRTAVKSFECCVMLMPYTQLARDA